MLTLFCVVRVGGRGVEALGRGGEGGHVRGALLGQARFARGGDGATDR